jgi:2-dehydropantoate 2-reductase
LLSLLNGISSEAVIADTYGTERVLDCVSLGMDAVKEGNHLTYHNMGQLSIGERGHAPTEKTHRVAEFFEQTKLPYDIAEDMNRRMWGKFMTNVGVNQAVAVFETNYGAVQREGKERDIMIAAMREVITLSKNEGVFLNEVDLSDWLAVLQTLSPDGKPSMRQDLEAKRPTELELFGGTVVELGRKHGIATPVNLWLVQKILEIEKSFHH